MEQKFIPEKGAGCSILPRSRFSSLVTWVYILFLGGKI